MTAQGDSAGSDLYEGSRRSSTTRHDVRLTSASEVSRRGDEELQVTMKTQMNEETGIIILDRRRRVISYYHSMQP